MPEPEAPSVEPTPVPQPNAADELAHAVAGAVRQSSSPVVMTTATSMSVASAAAVLEWAAGLLHVPMPDPVAVAIVAGLVPVAHLLGRYVSAKLSVPDAQKP